MIREFNWEGNMETIRQIGLGRSEVLHESS